MQLKRLGNTDIQISEIGFGCGGSAGLMIRGTHEDQLRIVAHAVESGVNFFDTSPLYGLGHSEANLGKVLHEIGAEPVVATKLEFDPENIGDIQRAIDESVQRSMERLHRDRLDVLFIHNRIGRSRDIGGRVLSIEDVLDAGGIADAMAMLKKKGLVRAIGITALGHTDSVLKVIRSGRFDVMQGYYNMINPSGVMAVPAAWRAQDYEGMISEASAAGMGVVGIRALAVGALGDSQQLHKLAKPYSSLSRAEVDADRIRGSVFRSLLPDGYPLSRFAIRFALAETALDTVLVGISEMAHLENALDAVRDGPLSAEMIAAVHKQFRELYETA